VTPGQGQPASRAETPDAPATGLPHPADRQAGGGWQYMMRDRGTIETLPGGCRLVEEGATARVYSNAQLDDYQGRRRRDFLWRPPLTLTVRARFSHRAACLEPAAESGLLGTAGFGFWNDPFMMTGRRPPALPRALWFFYASPPSDMKLDLRTPGWGWKAATIDAARWPVRLSLPLAPLVVPLMRIGSFYRHTWPRVQRLLNVCEARVAVSMTEYHTYTIEWHRRQAKFGVDGQTVLSCDRVPRGPLGLVIWIDNQYLVATPQGHFRYGLLEMPYRQWLELSEVDITR
jgi:hypothetical protein